MGPVPAALAFSAGILVVHTLAELPPPSALMLLAMPALLPWRGRALWSAAALGVLLTSAQAQRGLEERWPADRHGEELVVEGVIASLPERDPRATRFLFEPTAAPDLPSRIRAGWYDAAGLAISAGECWRLRLKLRHPHGSLNEGGSDYEGWLFRQGIGATATVREGERCEHAAAARLALRQRLANRIFDAVPDPRAAAVIAALTVGDRSRISPVDWDLFRLTGTTHLVAISGFNIAIVAALAFFAFRWGWSAWPPLCLRVPAQRVGAAGSALAAGAYGLLAGLEPPVLRAVLMLWIVLAAMSLARHASASRVLALAWLVVLALDPSAIMSPGIWLSFAAVAVIFYVSLGRVGRDAPWRIALRLQLLLSLALAPLSMFFFAGVSWVAPLVNLLAVPAFAALTPVALLAVLAAWAGSAELPLRISGFALDAFLRALDTVPALPSLWLPSAPPVPALVCAAAGLALLLAPRGLPVRLLGAICLAPLLLARAPPATAPFEIAMLDVGQGLAVAVLTPSRTLVYDTGPAFEDGFDAGESVVAPYLLARGRARVDRLVVSHGDRDHAGGADSVRRLLRIEEETGLGLPCVEGERWEWDGVEFEFLNGPAPGRSDNDGSCVLAVRAPGFSVLLAGDIEKGAEARLVERYGPALRSDVLVAPHHGSRTSSTPDFVAAVSPAVVLYGAGWRHHFRHPRPEVMARYAAHGARQGVTGWSGALRVTAGPMGPEVAAFRDTARRFWNAAPGP